MKPLIISTLILLLAINGLAQTPVKIWETDSVFSGPESAVYDQTRDVIYISNLRRNPVGSNYYGYSFISKIDLSGKILNLKWIENISEPTGICIFNDQLYIAERFGVVVVDLKTEKIEKRIRIKTMGFLNDITVGDDSTIYVSESNSDIIYSVKGQNVTQFIKGPEVNLTNGVLFDKGRLIVGANADSALKAIDIKTKKVTPIAQLPKGTIDGIKTIGEDLLISFFEGILYRINKEGKVTELLNTKKNNINLADFEYIENKKLLIVPALWNHKIIAYRFE